MRRAEVPVLQDVLIARDSKFFLVREKKKNLQFFLVRETGSDRHGVHMFRLTVQQNLDFFAKLF